MDFIKTPAYYSYRLSLQYPFRSSVFSATKRNSDGRRRISASISPPPSCKKRSTRRSRLVNKIETQMLRDDGVRKMSLMAVFFRTMEELIHKYLDLPLRPSIDPKYVLSGNFAAVQELPPTDCEIVKGSIPSYLEGAYIRNGPNPQFHPIGPYHLFEGDGMLHSIRISKGKATLCSRYVQTHKYIAERKVGSPVIANFYSSFNGLPAALMRMVLTAARVLAGHYNPANGIGLANTGLAYFGKSLYALGESDLPYAIRITQNGDVKTIGRHNFEGELSLTMTAHPKLDSDTGDVFAFQYSAFHPFLTYFRFDHNGKKLQDVPISSLSGPAFLHDFAITKKYAIFCDTQLGVNSLKKIAAGGPPVGADLAKVPRLGVLPRYAKDDSEMKWFDVPGFNIVHAINAWDEEETDEVVLVAPNLQAVEQALERLDLVNPSIEKIRINLKTGLIFRQRISPKNLEFSVINPSYSGKKNRYVYAAVGDPLPKITGVVKLDILRNNVGSVVARQMYGKGCFGGEPFFVARDPSNPAAEEDDGCLVSYMHDETAGESYFLVMDAKSPELEILATVKLPQRVPYGFHGLFVKETDLRTCSAPGRT